MSLLIGVAALDFARHASMVDLQEELVADYSGAERTADGWQIRPPSTFRDEELISAAATVYQEIADSNPQTMGKSKACYSQLHQLTALYRRLSQN